MANKYSSIDLSKYRNGYKKSKEVLQADAMKRASEIALKNQGEFKYKNQGMYDDVLDSILNRKAFEYDMNADALYQQYKNQYQALGKLAMEDTMGQASALTGGYGNSYAVTAGSQAYQNWLDKANEMIPEFYGMALNTYNAEGDRLANNFGVISADRSTDYGEFMDRYNQLMADRDYYANEYNNAYNRDYGQWSDNRAYDTDNYWNETNINYQIERDNVADQQWQKQYDYQVARDNVADQQWQKTYEMNQTKQQVAQTNTGEIPDYVLKKCETFSKNSDLEKYLDSLTSAGTITDAQADSLYAQYKQEFDALNERKWSLVDNGGLNWFWGIDNNAKVEDDDGNSFTLKELYNQLAETIGKDAAKEYVLELQESLGA